MKNFEHHLIDNWNIAKQFKIQQKEKEWLRFLSILYSSDIKNILEIGSYDGGSTISFSLICDNLVTIEFVPPRYDINLIKQNCNFTYVQGNSGLPEIVELIHKMPDIKFDLLFIDGNHVGEFAKLDFDNYKDMVRSGGLIAFHDIVDSKYHRDYNIQIYNVWNKLKSEYKHEEITELPLDWGGIGVVWMP